MTRLPERNEKEYLKMIVIRMSVDLLFRLLKKNLVGEKKLL